MLEHDRVRPSLATLHLLAERLRRPLSDFFDVAPAPLEQARVVIGRGETLLRQHRFTEAFEAFSAAGGPARDSGDATLQVRVELGLGQALTGLRQFDLGERHLLAARAKAEATGDVDLLASAANALGFLAFRARRLAQAREIFQWGIDLLRTSGRDGGDTLGKLLSNLGRVYVELGLPLQAMQSLRDAEGVVRRTTDPTHRALLLFNMGVACERQRSYTEAQAYLEQAETLLGIQENLRLLGLVRRSLGMLHMAQGDLHQAETLLSASLHLARESRDDEGTAQTLVELARLRVRTGALDQARRDAAEAEALANQIQDDAEAARAAAADGDARRAAGELETAVQRYEEAASVFQRLGMDTDLASVTRDLGYAYLALARHEIAARHFARAFDLQLAPAPAP